MRSSMLLQLRVAMLVEAEEDAEVVGAGAASARKGLAGCVRADSSHHSTQDPAFERLEDRWPEQVGLGPV